MRIPDYSIYPEHLNITNSFSALEEGECVMTEGICERNIDTVKLKYANKEIVRLFTRHDQHLGGDGKTALCAKILSKIKSLSLEQYENFGDTVAVD
ncbi:hypothetical protein J6590_058161 [Homalodisca vitripennis]|nr:hypothetical protein J6590_058161 [Homalodisca vitripennis]